MPQENGLLEMEGSVENIVYHNDSNQYTVLEVDCGEELITVVGTFPYVSVGERLHLYGTWTSHATFGQQFRAQAFERSRPADTAAMLKYLSSGAVKGIGGALAGRIIEAFGDESIKVIEEDPARLATVKGITLKKAKEISEEMQRVNGIRDLMAFLGSFGVRPEDTVKVWKVYGQDSVACIQEDPYRLCSDKIGISFAVADQLAESLEYDRDNKERVKAGVLYVLRHNAGNGHTCLPLARLVATTSVFIGVEQEKVQEELDVAVEDGELRRCDLAGSEYVYLPDLYSAEEDIAFRLADLTKYPAPQPKDLERNIDALERGQGFAYAPLQRQAIRQALTSNVLVLTGGPGTGKTTTVNAILALFEHQADRVALCAPTGRAAKRLAELTGRKASTIHRLLEVDYSQGTVRFIHNEKNLLKCDVVILDEMSMVDVKLFQSLLCALKHGCRIIMVGDADQLPSVGPGNILGEVIRSGVVPTVCLTEIFRQAAQSRIVSNAHRIVSGQVPENGGKTDDFFFIRSAGQACQQLVCELVAVRLPNTYHLDSVRDIQVLCPTKLGPSGTRQLNPRLQEMLNPPSAQKPEIKNGDTVFRLGDKVMQVRNNYDIPFERDGGEAGVGAYNGDIGVVIAVDPAQRTLKVQMDDRKLLYTAEHLPELEIAYAVTVHKSQGSEFPAVIMTVSEVPEKLCYRNLLYTGLTRARRLCVMPGQPATVAAMVRNVRQNLRYSGLCELLRQQRG